MKTLLKKWSLAFLLACMTFALAPRGPVLAEEYDETQIADYDDEDEDYDDEDEDYDDEDYDDEDVESGEEYFIDLDVPYWDYSGIYALPGENLTLTASLHSYGPDWSTIDYGSNEPISFRWSLTGLTNTVGGAHNQTMRITNTAGKKSTKPYQLHVDAYWDGEMVASLVTEIYITEPDISLGLRGLNSGVQVDPNKLREGLGYVLPIEGAYWAWNTGNKNKSFCVVEVQCPDGSKKKLTSGVAGSDIPNPVFSPNMEGTYQIQATIYRNDKVFAKTKKLTVKATGEERTDGKKEMTYRFLTMDFEKKTATVALVKSKKAKKSLKSLTVPDKVKINFMDEDQTVYNCTVVSISDKAFKGYTALKSVTIGKNVKEIGKSAFQGCKKLKTVKISGKNLKKVGKNALKGISKKATIRVPKAKKKAYKKLFKSSTGYKKSMKIK